MRYLRLVLLGLVASGALLVLLGRPEASGAIQAGPEVPLVTVTVTKTDDTADGTCDADCSLREAIIALKPSIPPSPIGTIILPAGTYTLGIPGTNEDQGLTGDLDIRWDVSIIGEGADSTIIDGAMLDRVFHVTGPINVEISGVTIRNGNAGPTGPVESPDLFIFDGGGLLFQAAGPSTLTDVIVTGNFAEGFGGGIANEAFDNLTLINSTISLNEATGGGGGIYIDGTATLTNSTVSDNEAADSGGGISNSHELTLTNSTVSDNTAATGGGISNSGELTLTNATVSGNTATDAGGGVNNEDGTLTLKDTIVANNASDDCSGGTTSAGYNLDSDGTCGLAAAGDISSGDPLLGPLADNGGPTLTHALLAGSPAIDTASDDCPPPITDQRGVTRPQGPACDIGAYELEVAAAPTPTPSAAELPAGGDGPAGGSSFLWLALVIGGLGAMSSGLILARVFRQTR